MEQTWILFRFSTNHRYKSLSMGSEDWKAMPVGDFIPDWDNNQLVGIKIAKCVVIQRYGH